MHRSFPSDPEDPASSSSVVLPPARDHDEGDVSEEPIMYRKNDDEDNGMEENGGSMRPNGNTHPRASTTTTATTTTTTNASTNASGGARGGGGVRRPLRFPTSTLTPTPAASQFVELHENELEECREAFGLFDKDRDGFVQRADLPVLMRSLGLAPTFDEVKKFCTENDAIRESDLVSFDEFLLFVRFCMSQQNTDDYIVEAFRHLDPTNSSFIAASELRNVLKSIGDQMTDLEIDDMFQEAGVQGSLVSFDEFMKMMKR